MATPLPAITGEMGWYPVFLSTQCNVMRLICRLIRIPDSRLCHKVFLWDQEISKRYKNTWFNNAKTIIESCGLNYIMTPENAFSFSIPHVLDTMKNYLQDRHHLSWIESVQNMPKLRTYKLIKSQFSTEEYLKKCLSRNQRSALSRMRCGTFPLELEKGRIRNIPVEQRICKMCDSGEVEDELHFMINCKLYSDIRNELLQELQTLHHNDFPDLSSIDKLKELLNSNKSKTVAKFIIDCSILKNQST